MRKVFIFFLLIFIISLPCFAAEPESRGVWVSTVYNLDYPSNSSLTQEQMKKEIDNIVYSAANAGLNTIFLQVRPECDAIYPSTIFPWSKYISGNQGQSPDGNFDSLAYFIETSHLRGIELHAWINPYRVTVSSFETIEDGLNSLHETNPAKINPNWVMHGNDKKLYFDPALPEVRKLIIDGITELADNYDIDGIHLDDYFYPDDGFNDIESFNKYGQAFENIEDFRRDNVNKIVQEISETCNTYDLMFGISPFGIWANYVNNELGSTTNGNQSYYSHYADSRLWVKEGWVDYIAPQLYWAIGSDEGEFERLLLWWRDTVSGTGVDLYIGLASYRSLDANADSIWYNGSEIIRQLKMIDMYGQTSGVIFFRYQSLIQSNSLSSYTSEFFTYPIPHIGNPVFLKNSRSLNIISPTKNERVVSQIGYETVCNASPQSLIYVYTDTETVPLRRNTEGMHNIVKSEKSNGFLFICDRSGFVSIKSIEIELLTSDKKNALTDIDWKTENGYTIITFYTDYPATANGYIKDDYVNLEISPARVGLIFECDTIRTMVCEDLDGYIRYIFDLYEKPKECFTKEYNDRIDVYIK